MGGVSQTATASVTFSEIRRVMKGVTAKCNIPRIISITPANFKIDFLNCADIFK
jgi:hypothetical protein